MQHLLPLAPAVQRIVAEAARVYRSHTDPWFVGLILHGSALKGGFIPNCSDIDFQLYLSDEAFTPEGYLPFPVAAAIQRDLSRIDPAPFRYIQCYAHRAVPQPGMTGPVPGSYLMLDGHLPVPEATAAELTAQARQFLERLNPARTEADNSKAALHHGDGRLDRNIRYMSTDVGPSLHHVLALTQPDPVAVWGLRKAEAMTLLPAELAGAAQRYYAAVHEHYAGGEQVETGLTVLERGLAFLRAVKTWYEDRRDQ